mmetsp:Transcript_6225/g.9705  ORF Transcript_6225/g.9705 Transcript_6225/m.9705 type:complete len:215 (+) Transcript_6225:375-1019(+)
MISVLWNRCCLLQANIHNKESTFKYPSTSISIASASSFSYRRHCWYSGSSLIASCKSLRSNSISRSVNSGAAGGCSRSLWIAMSFVLLCCETAALRSNSIVVLSPPPFTPLSTRFFLSPEKFLSSFSTSSPRDPCRAFAMLVPRDLFLIFSIRVARSFFIRFKQCSAKRIFQAARFRLPFESYRCSFTPRRFPPPAEPPTPLPKPSFVVSFEKE